MFWVGGGFFLCGWDQHESLFVFVLQVSGGNIILRLVLRISWICLLFLRFFRGSLFVGFLQDWENPLGKHLIRTRIVFFFLHGGGMSGHVIRGRKKSNILVVPTSGFVWFVLWGSTMIGHWEKKNTKLGQGIASERPSFFFFFRFFLFFFSSEREQQRKREEKKTKKSKKIKKENKGENIVLACDCKRFGGFFRLSSLAVFCFFLFSFFRFLGETWSILKYFWEPFLCCCFCVCFFVCVCFCVCVFCFLLALSLKRHKDDHAKNTTL